MTTKDEILFQNTLSRYDAEMDRRKKSNPFVFMMSSIVRLILLGVVIYLFYIAGTT